MPFLFILLLFGCAKKKVVFKPRPAPIPQSLPTPGFPGLRLEVNGQEISPLVPTLFLLPGDPLIIQVQKEMSQPAGNKSNSRLEPDDWSVLFNGQPMKFDGYNRFTGTVPQDPGFYPLKFINQPPSNQGSASFNFNQGSLREKVVPAFLVIVLHPFSKIKNGFLDQYSMGFYPNPEDAPEKIIPKSARSFYLPPKGFIEVTASNREVFISQNYRLQDFICHLNVPFPQFIALSPALLLKLEWLTLSLKQFTQNPEARLTILSGFRPPRYNQSVFGAVWSRHIYGDAADIILDLSPKDNQMDDLNQDGRIDREDILILYKLIEEIDLVNGLPGGVGIFSRGKNGPSLHIDTRGYKARW